MERNSNDSHRKRQHEDLIAECCQQLMAVLDLSIDDPEQLREDAYACAVELLMIKSVILRADEQELIARRIAETVCRSARGQ